MNMWMQGDYYLKGMQNGKDTFYSFTVDVWNAFLF